jgi:hypothetical protein
MKISKCRSCRSFNLTNVFSLGKQFYTGIFPSSKTHSIPKGELSMVFCNECSLLQLENSFDMDQMYGSNYGYLSSLNPHMVRHLKLKSQKLKKIVNLKSKDTVIDIGSNDGTFLKNFSSSYNLIGIDPTIKNLKKFYRKDILTLPNFFEAKLIKNNLLLKKKAKLVTSISMFYDLPDPIKFVEDIYEILDTDGIWHLEQSYMPYMIKNISYDTICHEHLEYYSLKSIKYIFDQVGFKIIDLEFNEINGGSFAITVAKKNSRFNEIKKIINWLLNKEEVYNYNSIAKQKEFFKNVKKHKDVFKNLLLNLKDMKKSIIGYGASTKGNVILQYCDIDQNIFDYIIDANIKKHNKFTPGSNIKIIHESKLKNKKIDYMVVLPWHFKSFILEKEKKYINEGGKLIFPLPDIEII